jgi:hypothetical protein
MRDLMARKPAEAEPVAEAVATDGQEAVAEAGTTAEATESPAGGDEEFDPFAADAAEGDGTEHVDAEGVAEDAPTAITAAPSADGGAIHQIMQRSLLDSEVTHFTVAQVIEFKEVGQTEISGVSYDFGMIDYRENTIFGERVYQAKALIRDGKVEKWIWPSNGMQIP